MACWLSNVLSELISFYNSFARPFHVMQVHSIPCVSCYEKSDFVNAINAYIEEKFPKPKPKKKRGFGAEYLHSSFAHDDF